MSNDEPEPSTQINISELKSSFTTPDFELLVRRYPDLLDPFYDSATKWYRFDLSNEQESTSTADCALATALLLEYLGIRVELDPLFLCPRLANRLTYIEWIHSLIGSVRRPVSSDEENEEHTRQVLGLDIGVGSSCIYPLLGCSVYPNWSFVGVDVDTDAVNLARRQVELNSSKLDSTRIKIVQKSGQESFFNHNDRFDFTMCNPPFYDSLQEIEDLKALKKDLPLSMLQAREHELTTMGGEVEFVSRMMEESFRNHEIPASDASQGTGMNDCWFTSMLGKKSSLFTLVQKLRDLQITNYAVHEIVTSSSNKTTRRWLLGWCFGYWRAPHSACQVASLSVKQLNPWPTEYAVPLNIKPVLLSSASIRLTQILANLCLDTSVASVLLYANETNWRLSVYGNIWSRSYRRYSAKRRKTTTNVKSTFLISLSGDQAERLTLTWEYGNDPKLLESLATMLKRKLEEN